eukprot:jgi/Ulvmu1/6772/UM030_0110.1
MNEDVLPLRQLSKCTVFARGRVILFVSDDYAYLRSFSSSASPLDVPGTLLVQCPLRGSVYNKASVQTGPSHLNREDALTCRHCRDRAVCVHLYMGMHPRCTNGRNNVLLLLDINGHSSGGAGHRWIAVDPLANMPSSFWIANAKLVRHLGSIGDTDTASDSIYANAQRLSSWIASTDDRDIAVGCAHPVSPHVGALLAVLAQGICHGSACIWQLCSVRLSEHFATQLRTLFWHEPLASLLAEATVNEQTVERIEENGVAVVDLMLAACVLLAATLPHSSDRSLVLRAWFQYAVHADNCAPATDSSSPVCLTGMDRVMQCLMMHVPESLTWMQTHLGRAAVAAMSQDLQDSALKLGALRGAGLSAAEGDQDCEAGPQGIHEALCTSDDNTDESDTEHCGSSPPDLIRNGMLSLLHSWLFLAELIPCGDFHTAPPHEQADLMKKLIQKTVSRTAQPSRTLDADRSVPCGAITHGSPSGARRRHRGSRAATGSPAAAVTDRQAESAYMVRMAEQQPAWEQLLLQLWNSLLDEAVDARHVLLDTSLDFIANALHGVCTAHSALLSAAPSTDHGSRAMQLRRSPSRSAARTLASAEPHPQLSSVRVACVMLQRAATFVRVNCSKDMSPTIAGCIPLLQLCSSPLICASASLRPAPAVASTARPQRSRQRAMRGRATPSNTSRMHARPDPAPAAVAAEPSPVLAAALDSFMAAAEDCNANASNGSDTGIRCYIGSALRAHRLLAAILSHASHCPLPKDTAIQQRFIAACVAMILMHANARIPEPTSAPVATGRSPGSQRRMMGGHALAHVHFAASIATLRTALRHHACTLTAAALTAAPPVPAASPATRPRDGAAEAAAPQVAVGVADTPSCATAVTRHVRISAGAHPGPRVMQTPAPIFCQSSPSPSRPPGFSPASQPPAPLDSPRTAAAKAAAAASAAAAGYSCEPRSAQPGTPQGMAQAAAAAGTAQAAAAAGTAQAMAAHARHADEPRAAQRVNPSTRSTADAGVPELPVARAVALSLIIAIKDLHRMLISDGEGQAPAATAAGIPVATGQASPHTPTLCPLRTPALAPWSTDVRYVSNGRTLLLTMAPCGVTPSQHSMRSEWHGAAAVLLPQGNTSPPAPDHSTASTPELFAEPGDAALSTAATMLYKVLAPWAPAAAAHLVLPPAAAPLAMIPDAASIVSLCQCADVLTTDDPLVAVFDQWLTHAPRNHAADDAMLVLAFNIPRAPGSSEGTPETAVHRVPAAALVAAAAAVAKLPVPERGCGLVGDRTMRRLRDLAGQQLLDARGATAGAGNPIAVAAASECVLRCACVAVELLGSHASPADTPPTAPGQTPAQCTADAMRDLAALLHMLCAVPAAVMQRFESAPATGAAAPSAAHTALFMSELPSARSAKAALQVMLRRLCSVSMPADAQPGHSMRSTETLAVKGLHCVGLCVAILLAVAALKASAAGRTESAADMASAADVVECVVDALEALLLVEARVQPAPTANPDPRAPMARVGPSAGLQDPDGQQTTFKAAQMLRLWLRSLLPAALECLLMQLQRCDAADVPQGKQAATRLVNFLCSDKDRVDVNGTVHHALCLPGPMSVHGAVRAAATKAPIASTAVMVCSHALAAAGAAAATSHRHRSWGKAAHIISGTRLAQLWALPAAEQHAAELRKRKLQPDCVERGPAEPAGAGRASKARRTCSHAVAAERPQVAAGGGHAHTSVAAGGGHAHTSIAAGVGAGTARHDPAPAAASGAQAGGVNPSSRTQHAQQGAEAAPSTPVLQRGVRRSAGRTDAVTTDAWLRACRVIVAAAAVDNNAAATAAPSAAPAVGAADAPAELSKQTQARAPGSWAAAAADAERAQHEPCHAPALMRIAATLSAIDMRLRAGCAARAAPDDAAAPATAAGAGAGLVSELHPCVTAARLAQAVPAERLEARACERAAAPGNEAAVPQRASMRDCTVRVQPSCMASAQVSLLFAPVASNNLACCALASVHILALTRQTAGVGMSLASDEFPAWAWNACAAVLADTLPDFPAVRPLVREPESLWHSTVSLKVLAQLLQHCADAVEGVAQTGYDAMTAAELAVEGAEDSTAAATAAADGGACCRAVLAVACMASARVILSLATCMGELAPVEAQAPSVQQDQATAAASSHLNAFPLPPQPPAAGAAPLPASLASAASQPLPQGSRASAPADTAAQRAGAGSGGAVEAKHAALVLLVADCKSALAHIVTTLAHAAVPAALDVQHWLLPEAPAEAPTGPVTRNASTAAHAHSRCHPLPQPLQAPAVAAVRFAAAFEAMALIADPLTQDSAQPGPPAAGHGTGNDTATPAPAAGTPATPEARIIAVDGAASPIICVMHSAALPPSEAPGAQNGACTPALTRELRAGMPGMHARRGGGGATTFEIPVQPGTAYLTMRAAACVICSAHEKVAEAVRGDARALQALQAGMAPAVHGSRGGEWACPATGGMHAAVVLDIFERCQTSFLDFLGDPSDNAPSSELSDEDGAAAAASAPTTSGATAAAAATLAALGASEVASPPPPENVVWMHRRRRTVDDDPAYREFLLQVLQIAGAPPEQGTAAARAPVDNELLQLAAETLNVAEDEGESLNSESEDISGTSGSGDDGDGSGDDGADGVGAHGSCAVSAAEDPAAARSAQRGAAQPRRTDRASAGGAAMPTCSVARSAAGCQPSRPQRGAVVPTASMGAGSVAGGAAASVGGRSSKSQRRVRKNRPAVSSNAFLNAAMALGQGSMDDVEALEDFVVADPERDYVSLMLHRYETDSESN